MINPMNKNIEIKKEGRRERGETIYQPNKTKQNKKRGKKNNKLSCFYFGSS